MIEGGISNSLLEMGYRRVDSNARGIYLYYLAKESELHIVSVIHAPNGNEITVEQYAHILEQVKEKFQSSYAHKISLLGLILTLNPDQAKGLSTKVGQDTHWIVDLNTNRLIIYETDSNEFNDIKEKLELLLVNVQQAKLNGVGATNYNVANSTADPRTAQYTGGGGYRPASWRMHFEPINTVIVGINLLIFLIMHYTNFFGGEDAIYRWGSLSWYPIKEGREYYRILTSMFMHADLSHLINNMIVLLFVGSNLERAAGRLKYLFIYFGSGIIAGITSISYNMWKEYTLESIERISFSVGASGAIFGAVGAILFIVIVNKGRLAQISARQMILFVVLSLYSGIVNTRIDQAAHIGGFLAGFVLALILYRKPLRKKVEADQG